MSTHALTVTLETNVHEEDIQPLIDAIRMMRYVADVTTHDVDINLRTAQVRVAMAVREKLYKLAEEL